MHCAGQAIARVRDILDRSDGKFDTDLDTKSAQIYTAKRCEVATRMHVSVNLPTGRMLGMVDTGVLLPTEPANIYSRLHRDNAEQAMGVSPAAPPPVYAALSLDCPMGAAPCFGPQLWLELESNKIRDRVTFTARDSYDVTEPWRADFDLQAAIRAFQREVFTWETVPDYYLSRFWGLEPAALPDYIEAQVWGGVTLEDVARFHAADSLREEFVAELGTLSRREPDRCSYITGRLVEFPTKG